ncbi:WD40 repeat-like protein [Rhizoclosmatium globosum]|uniref:Peroxin-7 n=1 Tax=Rhizoclosmatium globosum TaxID=329046 RepID=A0A1Y2A5E5_9FUNG|nr:WD40 repeat-like protein [Rhizoclosmatium globosum]|eukprot:ORY17722.1 WD40 repeat-like protein [Rhizoclosmatium globosum]
MQGPPPLPPPSPSLIFRTSGYQGYAVEFSPFFENRVAVASAANFGIAGNGRLFVLHFDSSNNNVAQTHSFDAQDGLFDLCWSEANENQIVVSSGDGSIKVFDLGLKVTFPVLNLHEHTREVFSVNWNLVRKDVFVSGSWDHSIKLWSPDSNHSISTWKEHAACVYSTVWSPHSPDRFASASGILLAHTNEVLSLDWNKYDPNCLVTAGVDHSVKVWDIRNTSKDLLTLRGHDYAVRRVKCSPHAGNIVASAGYDMTMRMWDTSRGFNNLVRVHDRHTEFVLGVDFSLFVKGLVATCAWDETVHLFHV